jgi:hypothetical protein
MGSMHHPVNNKPVNNKEESQKLKTSAPPRGDALCRRTPREVV